MSKYQSRNRERRNIPHTQTMTQQLRGQIKTQQNYSQISHEHQNSLSKLRIKSRPKLIQKKKVRHRGVKKIRFGRNIKKIDPKILTKLNKKIFNEINIISRKQQQQSRYKVNQQIDIDIFLDQKSSKNQSRNEARKKQQQKCEKIMEFFMKTRQQESISLINLSHTEQIIINTLKTYLQVFQNPSKIQKKHLNVYKSCRNQEQLLNIIAIFKKIQVHPYYMTLSKKIRDNQNSTVQLKLDVNNHQKFQKLNLNEDEKIDQQHKPQQNSFKSEESEYHSLNIDKSFKFNNYYYSNSQSQNILFERQQNFMWSHSDEYINELSET